MTAVRTCVVAGNEVLAYAEAIHEAYADAFGGAPWCPADQEAG